MKILVKRRMFKNIFFEGFGFVVTVSGRKVGGNFCGFDWIVIL